ncbi:hypothetical protein AFCDBAGC_2648 [Methylobacterium cerastii]|uniref:Uncharacterized protein n=1 Tax=Methylobacterium cerastii TaxID=932741 RepID=A0ABQ4QJ65_9HYPH|nr:hypothetical protein AFCDBAGC_2648 [Methylobacterium cerastii]
MTVVWKPDWSWSASVTDSVPVAVRLPLVSVPSSVTLTTCPAGTVITAASFVPVIVKVTGWVEVTCWLSVTLTL